MNLCLTMWQFLIFLSDNYLFYLLLWSRKQKASIKPIISEDNNIRIWKQECWIPQTSVYANEQMSSLKNLPCNLWRKPCCYAALYTQELSKACTHLHAYNYWLIHLPDSQKHWSPEMQRKWLVFKQTCQPELVLSSIRIIRQSFIFCPNNRRVISVCWLHYISAWFAWKAPLCFLAVGVMLLLRSSALLYSSQHGKITLHVLLKPYCFN